MRSSILPPPPSRCLASRCHNLSRISSFGAASLALLLTGVAIRVLGGCADDDGQVQAYTIAKEQAPPGRSVASAPPTADAAPASIEWDTPPGWQQKPNPSAMRFATLSAGAGENEIEVAISQLAGTAGGVTANIDRWRGQVGLGPLSGSESKNHPQEILARGAHGLMVDLIGPTPEGARTEPTRMLAAIFPAEGRTWFIKTTGPSKVIEQHREAFVALCMSVRLPGQTKPKPPPAEAAPPGSAAPVGPSWGVLPEGWAQDASPRTMSVASFRVSDGTQEAVLTITPLPGPPNLLGNINRWRRQCGLEPLADLAQEPPTEIEVAERAGHLVDLAGPSQHMLGAIVPRDGTVWFYKMSGPDPLVGNRRADFETFMRSVSFAGGAGG